MGQRANFVYALEKFIERFVFYLGGKKILK